MTEENKNDEFSLPPLPDGNAEFVPPPIPEGYAESVPPITDENAEFVLPPISGNPKISEKKLYIISGIVLALIVLPLIVIGIAAITTISENKSETIDSNYYSKSNNTLKDGEVGLRDQYGNEYGVQIDEDYYARLNDGVNSSSNNITSNGTSAIWSSQIADSGNRSSDYGYEESSSYSSGYESPASSSNNDYTFSSTPKKNEYKVGNKITFGKQHDWLVLDVQDGKALIFSLSGTPEQYYDDAHRASGNTWETSDLRKELNEHYYNVYFTIPERNRILTTDLINESNPDWGTDGGHNTQDKIFILSASEILKYSDTIIKFKTDNINVWKMKSFLNKACWLRTPGRYFLGYTTSFYRLTQENENGSFHININYEGTRSGTSGYCYPAMWIKIDG